MTLKQFAEWEQKRLTSNLAQVTALVERLEKSPNRDEWTRNALEFAVKTKARIERELEDFEVWKKSWQSGHS